MLASKLEKLAEDNPDVISAIEREEITEEEEVSGMKARLLMIDGTVLWVREVLIQNVVTAYSYYWLRPDGSVIIGWDNAPHHREVFSFPHHKHIGGTIEASSETDLPAVIACIRGFLV
jgi:hypothetical protein